MTKLIRIVDLSASYAIPIKARKKLEGLEVPAAQTEKIQVVTHPTMGYEAAVAGYEMLNEACYVFSRADLLHMTESPEKHEAHEWLETLEVDKLLFCKSCCEEV